MPREKQSSGKPIEPCTSRRGSGASTTAGRLGQAGERPGGAEEGLKSTTSPRHPDPQLVWSGKAEHASFEVRRSRSTSTSGSTRRRSSRPCGDGTRSVDRHGEAQNFPKGIGCSASLHRRST